MFKRILVPSFRHVQHRNSHNLLSVTESDGVRNITMVDGKTRNCLSMAMMESLIDEIRRNEDDKTLRVIVLSSTGPVFSAGHNLKELSPDKGYASQKNVFIKCHELIRSIHNSPLPVISKIDGLAAGESGDWRYYGCQLSFTFSRRFATRRFMWHRNLQFKELVFDPRRKLRHFLQHARHRNFSSDPKNEV